MSISTFTRSPTSSAVTISNDSGKITVYEEELRQFVQECLQNDQLRELCEQTREKELKIKAMRLAVISNE